MASHVMDMATKIAPVISEPSGDETRVYRAAPRRTRGGTESFPQEQASQEGYLNERSTRTQHQQDEIDELRRIVNNLEHREDEVRIRHGRQVQEHSLLTNAVHHLERQGEEVRIRQEILVQELNNAAPQLERRQEELFSRQERLAQELNISLERQAQELFIRHERQAQEMTLRYVLAVAMQIYFMFFPVSLLPPSVFFVAQKMFMQPQNLS